MIYCLNCEETFDGGNDKIDQCPECGSHCIGSSFEDDDEKMRDFAALTRSEFLQSYSYLTIFDYAATIVALGIGGLCDLLGWKYNEYEQDGKKYAEIENFSPAGEDLVETVWFDGTMEGFRDGLQELYEDFDPDDHVEMWIQARASGREGIPPARVLAKDADDIEDMLLKLWDFFIDKTSEMKG